MEAMDTQITTYSDDELTAALAEHLASLDRDDSYRVERVLKRSSVETTELVYFEGTGGGSLGPLSVNARCLGSNRRGIRASVCRSAGRQAF